MSAFKIPTKNTNTSNKAYEKGTFNNIHKYQKVLKEQAKAKEESEKNKDGL
jgi:hypothetical protein